MVQGFAPGHRISKDTASRNCLQPHPTPCGLWVPLLAMPTLALLRCADDGTLGSSEGLAVAASGGGNPFVFSRHAFA